MFESTHIHARFQTLPLPLQQVPLWPDWKDLACYLHHLFLSLKISSVVKSYKSREWVDACAPKWMSCAYLSICLCLWSYRSGVCWFPVLPAWPRALWIRAQCPVFTPCEQESWEMWYLSASPDMPLCAIVDYCEHLKVIEQTLFQNIF